MNSRERVLATLSHLEPDKVPIDLGDNVTGIHITAYRKLLDFLGIEDNNIRFSNFAGQTVVPCEELLQRFEIDTRYLQPPLHTIPESYTPIVLDNYILIFFNSNVLLFDKNVRFTTRTVNPCRRTRV
ncbi:MAG: hypothetical protein ACW972_12060 [Promethearchaeota archaeon]|jgi:hypothetical protein